MTMFPPEAIMIEELPEYETAVDALKPALAIWSEKLVAIGGRPGVGKTPLARYLAWRFNAPLIETDLFLIQNDESKLLYRNDDIASILEKRRGKPVFVEGTVVLRLLSELGRHADYTIYVANKRAPDQFGLRKEIRAYEKEYRPTEQADLRLSLSVL
jgi:adenylate kinase family enzyme